MMRRLFTMVLVLLAFSVFVAPVMANNGNDDSPPGSGVLNKARCEAMGGFWVNNKGEKSCNVLQEVEVDPESVGSDDPDIDPVLRQILDEDDKVVFEISYTQRGNIGSRAGELVILYNCKQLAAGNLLSQTVCDFLQNEYNVDTNPLDR